MNRSDDSRPHSEASHNMNSGPSHTRRLYRNKSQSMLGGVCSGIGDHLGLNRWLVRLVTVMLLFSPINSLVVIGYIIAWIIVPKRPEDMFTSPREEQLYRDINSQPRQTFGDARQRMRELEQRLRRMEAFITSPHFDIDEDLRPTPRSKVVNHPRR